MTRHFFDDNAWYRALSPHERGALSEFSHRRQQPSRDSEVSPLGTIRSCPSADAVASHRSLSQYDQQPLLGVDSAAIRSFLNHESARPSWLNELEHSFLQQRDDSEAGGRTQSATGGAIDFAEILSPLLDRSWQELVECTRAVAKQHALQQIPKPVLLDLVNTQLTKKLAGLLTPTLVLELNVARINGRLKGTSSIERYQSFLDSLKDPEIALRLLQEYPVLARQTVQIVSFWNEACQELIVRLYTDWQHLNERFGLCSEPTEILQLQLGLGDTHCGGRAVAIIQFASGRRLIYKPRSMQIDLHFQAILAWLNDQGLDSPYRVLHILNRNSHGWREYVEMAPCNSTAEVRRFYQRQGGYLALLYSLEATDFHYENIVASGEHPILVDLETLFQPRVLAPSALLDALRGSVLNVGLLPRLILSEEGEPLMGDTSGFGGAPGQVIGQYATFAMRDSDQMHIVNRERRTVAQYNRPSLLGNAVKVADYSGAIIEGFREVYEHILKNRQALLRPGGLISQCADDHIRVVLRPTRYYGALLRNAFHPEFLSDAVERQLAFEPLLKPVEHTPVLERVVDAEREDLEKGDIPYFRTQPSSRDLWTSGDRRIVDALPESSWSSVTRRIESLGNQDLCRQISYIRTSIECVDLGALPIQLPRYSLGSQQVPADRPRLLAAAIAIANRLRELSFGDSDQAWWLGLSLVDERLWTLAPIGTDLYNGFPGLILFFAYLGAVTGDDQFTRAANQCLSSFRRIVNQRGRAIDIAPSGIGLFNGACGWIYVLSHLATLWNDERMLIEATDLLSDLAPSVATDQRFDIVGGSAGCIAAAHSLTNSPNRTKLMILCARHLVDSVIPVSTGVAWKSSHIECSMPLVGFAHGTGGIASALLQAWSCTGEIAFRNVAEAAIAYERSVFSADAENWPDFRYRRFKPDGSPNDDEATFPVLWCHGAAGVGVARLRCLSYLNDSYTHQEIETAVKTTLRFGFGRNHCLCHGDLGNIDFLLEASQRLNDNCLAVQAYRAAGMVLDRAGETGWQCGTPKWLETPGLMAGLAGIGYGLLRLADPARVPSVLAISPAVT